MNGFAWKTVIVVLGGALTLAVADLLVITCSLLLLIFAGLLFGLFLNAITRIVARFGQLPYSWSYYGLVIVMIAVIAGASYLMGTRIVSQTARLTEELQQAGERVTSTLEQYGWTVDRSQIPTMLTEGMGPIPTLNSMFNWVLWGLTGGAVIFFVGLYVAFDPDLYETGMLKLFPLHQRDHAQQIMRRLRSTLANWIVGRLTSMSIVGVSTAMGLWLLGVPLPLTLGLLAALLTFIPNIGPILAAIPQALVAFPLGINIVMLVVLLNVALQSVESYLITPVIQRWQVSLPPALTIAVQLLLGTTIGIMGLMMAAPLTASILVITQTLYIKEQLGDPTPGELAESPSA